MLLFPKVNLHKYVIQPFAAQDKLQVDAANSVAKLLHVFIICHRVVRQHYYPGFFLFSSSFFCLPFDGSKHFGAFPCGRSRAKIKKKQTHNKTSVFTFPQTICVASFSHNYLQLDFIVYCLSFVVSWTFRTSCAEYFEYSNAAAAWAHYVNFCLI